MPLFDYKGKTTAGAIVAGQLKAKDRRELERMLRGKKILVTEANPRASQLSFKIGGKRIKKIHISRFTRQFATMIGAGLPMVQCLEILSQQSESTEFGKTVDTVRENVQSGTTLSEALSRQKKVFDDLYYHGGVSLCSFGVLPSRSSPLRGYQNSGER